MTVALLLSGQGTQSSEMFRLTADLPGARSIFEAAAARLDGCDPRDLVRRDGADIHSNRTGQILCVTAALAGWQLVSPAITERAVVAGYSIGDLAAAGVAGWLEPETVIDLAAQRAEAMDNAAGHGHGLAGIRGLPLDRIADLAEGHGAHLAIRNGADSAVVGGSHDALEVLCSEAKRGGAARAVRLEVRVPSHTPVLAAATESLRPQFLGAPVRRPPASAPRWISGLDGAAVFAPRVGLEKLARQVSETIDWAACLSACDEFGATTILELGPGHALARMADVALPGRRVRALEDFATADGVRNWVLQASERA